MYIATRRYRLVKGALDEVVRRTEKEGLPEFRKIPGFVDYYYVNSGDSVMAISVYETRESAEKSTRMAADWVKKNIPNLYVGAPELFSGEVLIHSLENEQTSQAA